MGVCLNKASSQKKIIILGLENSGKTTMLYQLSKNKQVPAIPTVGKNEEFYIHKGKKYLLLDFGGRQSNFNNIRQHFENVSGIVFMIDINVPDSYQKSHELFSKVLKESQLTGLPILIFLNKTDLQKYDINDQEEEIKKIFKLESLQNCLWTLKTSSAFKRDNLVEGFELLVQNISNQRTKKGSSASRRQNDAHTMDHSKNNQNNNNNVQQQQDTKEKIYYE